MILSLSKVCVCLGFTGHLGLLRVSWVPSSLMTVFLLALWEALVGEEGPASHPGRGDGLGSVRPAFASSATNSHLEGQTLPGLPSVPCREQLHLKAESAPPWGFFLFWVR